ncbi:hypothetical protein [Treponema sp. R80B11-R83G3]
MLQIYGFWSEKASGKKARGCWGDNAEKSLEIHLLYRYYIKVRAFKYTRFSRFANKEGITDRELLEIVDQLEAEQADAKEDFELTDAEIRAWLDRGTLIEITEGD